MSKTVGAVLSTRVVAGLIEDHKLEGGLKEFPENIDDTNGLIEVPAESLCDMICDAIASLVPKGSTIDAAGVALPGYVHQGVMLDAPNLPQLKGAQVSSNLSTGLKKRGIDVKLAIFNDADAVAAGIAATRGQLDRQVRVWTIGNGIGLRALSVYGRAVGGWAHGGDARPEGEILRLRRARASGRHHGQPGDAAAISGHGARRSFCGGEEG